MQAAPGGEGRTPGAGTIALGYAAAAAAWIILSTLVLEYAVADPSLLGRLELAKGLGFVAITTLALYALLRRRDGPPEAPSLSRRARRRVGSAVAAGVGAAVVLTSAVYVIEVRQEERDAFGDLEVVAELKVAQIEQWVLERKGDALSLAHSAGFVEQVANLHGPAGAAYARHAINRLTTMMDDRYDAIVVVDPAGEVLLTLDPGRIVGETHRRSAAQVPDGEAVRIFGIERGEGGHPHLTFATPLLQARAEGKVRIGTAILHVSPATYLYPLVQSWPSNSPTGETLLVRRSGDSVLFLNELRHRKGAALALQVPLDSSEVPAAQAVRLGRPGRAKGLDYRGTPVLAAFRPVSGTGWFLVAKRDRAEVVASAQEVAKWVGLVAAVALSLLAIGTLGYLRVRRRLDTVEAERRTDALQRRFFELPFIGMAISSPGTKRWLQFNDRLCEILGRSREDVARIPWDAMTHPDDLARDVAEFERVLRGERDGYALEKRFLRGDGEPVETVIDVRSLHGADGRVEYLLCTVDDVTGRRRAERRLLRLTRLYATLSACNAAVVQCATPQALFERVCRAMIDAGGMRLAWIGLVDADGHAIVPAASAGTEGAERYLQGIRIVVDGDDPHGRGPSGTAVREGRMFWTEDFMSDPRTAPWHERAASYRIGSSAAFPLRRGGAVVGAITAYFSESGALDEEMRGLLEEMGRAVSHALESFDREARRERSEAERRSSEARYRLLFENSIDAILIGFQDGRIESANPAACRMLGWTETEIVAGGRGRVVDASDVRLSRGVEERRRTGRYYGELTMLKQDGTKFPAEVATSVFRTESGEERTCVIFRDITERKAAEARLREQFDELHRWFDATLGREERIVELKREVNALARRVGAAPPYDSVE